jgi:hypothetical protein
MRRDRRYYARVGERKKVFIMESGRSQPHSNHCTCTEDVAHPSRALEWIVEYISAIDSSVNKLYTSNRVLQ